MNPTQRRPALQISILGPVYLIKVLVLESGLNYAAPMSINDTFENPDTSIIPINHSITTCTITEHMGIKFLK